MLEDEARQSFNRIITPAQFKLLLEYLIIIVGSDVFTGSERVYLEQLYARSLEDARSRFSAAFIYSATYFLLFHFRVKFKQALQAINGNFGILQELLSRHGSATWQKIAELQADTTLIGQELDNKSFGRAIVSAHAWQRFFERVSPQPWRPSSIRDVFSDAFCLAKPCNLPAEIRVIRIINSNFKGAHYLWNKRYQLRFVLSVNQDVAGAFQLITVEKPKLSLTI